MTSLCLDQSPIDIYRGESLLLELDLFNPDLRVLKLLDILRITVTFTDQNGIFLSKTLLTGVTIVDAEGGQITVAMGSADTSILPAENGQTFGVFVEYNNGDARAVEYERRLNVKVRTGGS